MTIEKGASWGEPGVLPDSGVVASTDAEARHALEEARRRSDPYPALGLIGGDLCRTLGGRGDPDRLRTAATVVPVDLGVALVDGEVRLFVAHVVVRGPSLWRGRVLAVMNAEFLGSWDVAPRAHPNDGTLDLVEAPAGFGVRDRWKARRRLVTGTHLPHPGLVARRAAAFQFDVGGQHVWIDGRHEGRARSLSVRVEPDALTCVV